VSGSAGRVVVLGTGRVGALIARDLAEDAELTVTAVDRSEQSLETLRLDGRIEAQLADLSDAGRLAPILGAADLVIGAVPGAMGHAILCAAIEARRPVVDIAFAPEDPLVLDAAARRAGVPVVVDCGVAPGISNWLVGRGVAEMDQAELVEIMVGGLPLRRVWPYEYRAVFSPTDVIEEYTRPCRMRENGREVTVPALSGVELVELPHVGTVEAFNTDGLRTLLQTIPAPTLREKTLRYPGHAEKMRMLREGGFFGELPVDLDGTPVVPRQLTEKLLFEDWALPPGDEEVTVLRVKVRGRRGTERVAVTWDLFDRTDPRTGETSMARTTGFPCAIVGRMILGGRWTEPGVHPPELLGRDERLTAELLSELRRRGVQLESTTVVESH
jgi:saccharopine dehydrogenase-like NADP-dependent oxidoreductase